MPIAPGFILPGFVAYGLAAAGIMVLALEAHAQRACDTHDKAACVPDIEYGLGEDLRLTLGTSAAADAKAPDGHLDTLRDLFAALRACWKPPAAESAHRGMQMSMRFALNRDGKLMGTPQVTYATRDVSKDTRETYRQALAQSLQNCTPLSLSKGLGGAIAGRPISIRVIDDRDKDRQTSKSGKDT